MKYPFPGKAVLASAALAWLCAETGIRAQTEPKAATEAARRQDFTGKGTFHRSGMLREQENARRAADLRGQQPGEASAQGTAKAKAEQKSFLGRWLSRIFGRRA